MNLYLLSQNKNSGYDTYDSCVICAESELEAICIHPNGEIFKVGDEWEGLFGTWINPEHVTCEEIGTADESQKANTVICASFNAG